MKCFLVNMLVFFLLSASWMESTCAADELRAITATCEQEENTNYPGHGITNKTIPNGGTEDCARWCGETEGCNFWTFNQNNNCWLMYSVSNKETINRVTSGNKACGIIDSMPGYKLYAGLGESCYLIYTKVEPYPADPEATLLECKTMCDQEPQCEAFLMEKSKIKAGEKARCFMIKPNDLFTECVWSETGKYNAYQKLAGAELGTCLSSPGFPDSYPFFSDTEQSLEVRAGQNIRVTFFQFDIEQGSSSCPYDYVKFLDASGEQVGAKLCGNSLPQIFTIESSTAKVIFHSDGVENKKGFKLCYSPGDEGVEVVCQPLVCSSYIPLSDKWRRIQYEVDQKFLDNPNLALYVPRYCDQTGPPYDKSKHHYILYSQLTPQWYRFTGLAGSKLPTAPAPGGIPDSYTRICGTNSNAYIASGGHPKLGEGIVTRDICWEGHGKTCGAAKVGDKKMTVRVAACKDARGEYFVYELQPTDGCDFAYCALP